MSLAERFADKFTPVPEAGCWLWTASTNAQGYGQIMVSEERSPRLAHRVSWQMANGGIPGGLRVLHKCDTPSCVNPDHLFLGTDADNVRDMYRKGRNNPATRVIGTQHGMAILTDAQAREIYAADGRHADIAKAYGVCKATVSHIKTGRQWSHTTGAKKREDR